MTAETETADGRTARTDGGGARGGSAHAEQAAAYWDALAGDFDEQPDHGLRDPAVRAAWARRLRGWLPEGRCELLDLGCGTGSLALLAAGQGHRVTALDVSPRMARLAGAKLAGTDARVVIGDAALPPVAPGRFDVVLVRHVLWSLPEPAAALRRWAGLLRRGGRLVLVEGRWDGEFGAGGIPAASLAELAAPLAARTHLEDLSHDAALWGRPVRDERYALVVHPAPPRRHAEIVDVHLILRRADGRVLLARRSGTGYADGLLNAPSGHLEDGEDVREAVIREAREEVGVVIDPAAVRVALVMQHRAPAGQARIGWFFEVREWQGEPVNREPHKCSGIGWYPLDALPDDLVAYCRAGFDAYRAGDRFLLHWHQPEDSIAHRPAGPVRAVVLPHNGSGDPARTADRTPGRIPGGERET